MVSVDESFKDFVLDHCGISRASRRGGCSAATGSIKTKPEPEWIKPAWVALVEMCRGSRSNRIIGPLDAPLFSEDCLRCYRGNLPTELHYQKGGYGPFSQEVKGLIARLINNGLIREERLGRMLAVKVGPTFFDARKAYTAYLKKWEPIIEKTTDLFMRVNSNQAEVVATLARRKYR